MTREIRDTDRYEAREGLVVEEIDGEVVILDLQKNVYFGLNEVARIVWRGFEDEQTIGDIVAQLVEEFDVGREDVSRDVHEFVKDALSNELISPVSD